AVVLVEVAHRLGGVAQGRAAGAEGAGHVFGRMHLAPARGAVQLRALVVGLGPIELEAERGHGGPWGGFGPDYISPSRWMCNRFGCDGARGCVRAFNAPAAPPAAAAARRRRRWPAAAPASLRSGPGPARHGRAV